MCYSGLRAPSKYWRKVFAEYGIPNETDHGTQLVPPRNMDEARHRFKDFPVKHGVKHIVARIKNLQTNGKVRRMVERSFGEVESRPKKFGSVDAVVG